jgi:hypothetical protein
MSWKCPECKAPAHRHGKGGAENCKCDQGPDHCDGLICNCDVDTGRSHGSAKDPCTEAHCYHCGWLGTIPADLVMCPKCKGSGRIKRVSGER